MVVIVGSTREGRIAPRIVDWLLPITRADGRFALEVVDLREAGLPAHLTDDVPTAASDYLQCLARADAFVVVTPEYNHAYPAPLKQAIDLGLEEWFAKPVAFVSYGGISGGLRAVEQLRLVFSELHAVTLRDGVCIPNCWTSFGEDRLPDGVDVAAKTMLDRLAWWATALRVARATQPYAA
nr:NAD(P)H-dependent oxidoreductase [Nocardioides thalensis]